MKKRGGSEWTRMNEEAYIEFGVPAIELSEKTHNLNGVFELIDLGIRKYPECLSLLDLRMTYLVQGINEVFDEVVEISKQALEEMHHKYLEMKKEILRSIRDYSSLKIDYPEFSGHCSQKIFYLEFNYLNRVDDMISSLEEIGIRGGSQKRKVVAQGRVRGVTQRMKSSRKVMKKKTVKKVTKKKGNIRKNSKIRKNKK